MRFRRRRRFLYGLLVAGGIAAVFCAAFCVNLLSGVQLQGGDFLFKAPGFGSSEVGDRIVVVGIDDKSLEQLGHFPSWPRTCHASLVDLLTEAGARVVVFDVLFSEPAPGDEELAASIAEAGNVILPVVYTFPAQEPSITGGSGDKASIVRSLAEFEEGAAAVGHANVLPDGDGVVRRLPAALNSGGELEPALSLAAVAKYLRRPEIIEGPVDGNHLSLAGRSIPLDESNGMIINYVAGSPETGAATGFPTVSYVDALTGQVDPAVFRDKIVVIGATASGIEDRFWAPTGCTMSGVYIHANAMRTILAADFLRAAPAGATYASIVVLALVCGLLVMRLRVLWATLSAAGAVVVYLLVAFTAFDRGVMLNMVYPPMAVAGSFVGVNLYSIASERAERTEITRTFGRYISPSVVDKVLGAVAKGELKLQGEECEVTVLFADIRGFTSVSENIGPEELVRVLNMYLAVVVNAVLENDGMVNKFGGDSVMAVWNVPTASEGHALLATKAAIQTLRGVRELRASDAILPEMDFRIGINTGPAVAGSLGSEDRLEYSVVGDTVNIAARLTALAEAGRVWIGSETYRLIKDHVSARPLEPLTVKGKREPVMAYEVLDVVLEPVNDGSGGQVAVGPGDMSES